MLGRADALPGGRERETLEVSDDPDHAEASSWPGDHARARRARRRKRTTESVPPHVDGWPPAGGHHDASPRQLGERLVDALLRQRVVLQPPRQETVVGGEIEVAVTAQRGQDHLLLAALLA